MGGDGLQPDPRFCDRLQGQLRLGGRSFHGLQHVAPARLQGSADGVCERPVVSRFADGDQHLRPGAAVVQDGPGQPAAGPG